MSQEPNNAQIDRRTIADFGRQWTRYTDNAVYYGSTELLADIVEPLLPIAHLSGLTVAEIGSGSGRIMLLSAGVRKVIASEPSDAVLVLRQNTETQKERVEIVHATGESLAAFDGLDLVVSIGVLHHIVDSIPALNAAMEALRPGGRALIWVYGREGNEFYLATVGNLRKITSRLPHRLLAPVCGAFLLAAMVYTQLCRVLPLPMPEYMLSVFGRLTSDKRKLVIYDQLNPAYAKYYRGHETHSLLVQSGFQDVREHHRHGSSWTVIGVKPTMSSRATNDDR